MSGRAGAGSSRSSSGRQRQAVPIVVGDAGEEDEDEEDDSMLNQHNQVQYLDPIDMLADHYFNYVVNLIE
jgi:hypothetical protein